MIILSLLLQFKDIFIKGLIEFFKLLKRFPWLILIIISLIYISYLQYQILNFKNILSNVNDILISQDTVIQNVHQSNINRVNNTNDLNKILMSKNDSLSKEILKVIKRNKEEVNQIIDIKFKERTYSTDSLEQGILEKVDMGYKISFNKVFDDASISGYILYPQALYNLNAVFKPRNFKIIETRTETGLMKLYSYPSTDSGIESIEAHSMPMESNKSFWRKFDPDLVLSYKSYNVFSGDIGVQFWKIKPMVGADIWHNGKSYLFAGVSVKLF